ncbi:kinesin-like protein KIF22 [Mustelus asterias]
MSGRPSVPVDPPAASASRKPASRPVRVAVRLRPYQVAEDEEGQGACVRGVDTRSLEIANRRNRSESMHYQWTDSYLWAGLSPV